MTLAILPFGYRSERMDGELVIEWISVRMDFMKDVVCYLLNWAGGRLCESSAKM